MKTLKSQFNIRLPDWLREEIKLLAAKRGIDNLSMMAVNLLRDAVFSAKGECCCARPGVPPHRGKSGMPCVFHSDIEAVFEEHHPGVK